LNNVESFIYLIISFIVGTSTPGFILAFAYFSEMAPTLKRPKYMAIESAFLLPLAFASYIFGVVADKVGFVPIYITLIIGAVSICLIALFKLLKPEELSIINP
jgi:hypothetical protein